MKGQSVSLTSSLREIIHGKRLSVVKYIPRGQETFRRKKEEI